MLIINKIKYQHELRPLENVVFGVDSILIFFQTSKLDNVKLEYSISGSG